VLAVLHLLLLVLVSEEGYEELRMVVGAEDEEIRPQVGIGEAVVRLPMRDAALRLGKQIDQETDDLRQQDETEIVALRQQAATETDIAHEVEHLLARGPVRRHAELGEISCPPYLAAAR